MVVFWRKEPLSEREIALWRALMKAHALAVFRDNPSSVLVKVVADSAGDYTKAMIAALSSLGGKHAPVEEIVEFLNDNQPTWKAREILEAGGKVPGWGSSFVKGEVDPNWKEVDAALLDASPDLWKKIWDVTNYLYGTQGRKIFPNPGCYTAATAIALALPPKLAPWLLVRARLDAWAQIFADHCG